MSWFTIVVTSITFDFTNLAFVVAARFGIVSVIWDIYGWRWYELSDRAAILLGLRLLIK